MDLTGHTEFDTLYQAHQATVRRCVASFGIPRDIWPDILQDVWLTANSRLDELVAHPKPAAWLCTVARNHAMHYIRSHLRRHRKHLAIAVEPLRDVLDPFRDRDAWDTLNRLLTNCPLEQREVYLRIELHGMTASEVADEMGISVNTVHSRLRLTRLRLRDTSAVLVAVLLVLRAQIARELPPGPGTTSNLVLDRLQPVGPVSQPAPRPASGGTAIKVALAALLALPAAESRPRHPVLVVEQTAASRGIDSPRIESEYIHYIHIPFVTPWAVPDVTDLPAGASAPEWAKLEPAEPRVKHARQPVRSASRTRPRGVPIDDGEDLLRAAQDAYRDGRFERALDFALRHRRRHPASELRNSREILVVRALCQIGRSTEAREHVVTFARESPDERAFRASLAKLRSACRPPAAR